MVIFDSERLVYQRAQVPTHAFVDSSTSPIQLLYPQLSKWFV